jgi:hypothetical protein
MVEIVWPHLLLTSFDLWLDALRFISLSLRPNWALVAENLFLRKQLALYLERKMKPTGRPRVPIELRKLIAKMANENPTWGEERIAAELLLKLGIRISPRTVSRYMPGDLGSRRGPSFQRWMTFVRNHPKDFWPATSSSQ